MPENIPRKKNALLGGLLVFIVPVFLISLIYFSASRFPKPKQIPVVMQADSLGFWQIQNQLDSLTSTDLPVDIKLIFSVDSQNLENRIALLNPLIETSKTFPEFSLKEPYAQTYFIALADSNLVAPDTLYHWRFYDEFDQFPIKTDNKLLVLDSDGNLRGSYEMNKKSIDSLSTDLQYLLQETFYSNSKKIKIKRLFKTSEELNHEEQ